MPFALAAFVAKGWPIFLDRHIVIVSVTGCVMSVPAIFMMYRFGSANLGSVSGRPGDLAWNTWDAWLFYVTAMPNQCGYVTVFLATIGVPLAASGRLKISIDRWMWWLLISWFVSGYVLLSAIGLRNPRHDLVILFPVILLAGLTVFTLIGRASLARQPSWRCAARPMATACSGIRLL
jgi:hypothetical protein